MRKLLIAQVFLAACTDTNGVAIEIPFALYASDETSTSSTGVCTISPVTQAGGLYKGSGLLELDPALNPNAEYQLNLQVENYLSQETLSDSTGNTLAGENENDFHMQKACIKYIDIQGNLSGVPDNCGVGGPSDVALISGTVRTGGTQGATAVTMQAVSATEILPWATSFLTSANLGVNNNATEDVILEVQIFGTLSSGEQISSGLFDFPLTLCFGCEELPLTGVDAGSAGVLWEADCPKGSAPIEYGHGPCCASQDFYVSCTSCGDSVGGACCGQTSSSPPSCSGTLTCTGSAPQGVEICPRIPSGFSESATCASSS